MITKIRAEIASLTPFQQGAVVVVLMVSLIAALALVWCIRWHNKRNKDWH